MRAVAAGLVTVEVIVLVLWAGDATSGSSASEAARGGLVAWGWVHHALIRVPGGVVGFTPPLLLLLPLWLLRRAAKRVHPELRDEGVEPLSWREGARATMLLALPYAALASIVSMSAHTQGLEVEAISAAVGPFVLALVGVGSWCLAPTLRAQLAERGEGLRQALRAGGIALGVMLLSGMILTTGSLLWHFSYASELAGAITTSPIGSIGLLLLSVAILPAAGIWGAAVAAGPGFSIGAGTAVTAGSVHLGNVPALSLFAALPQSGPAPLVLRLMPAVMVIAGLMAGLHLHRRAASLPLANRCGLAVVAGAVCGLAMALMAALSGGPVAPGRLEVVGPSAWRVGLGAAEAIGLIAAVAVALLHWNARRARSEA